MTIDPDRRAKFEQETVPLILAQLGERWEYEPGAWVCGGLRCQFLLNGQAIDHWMKPEAIIASLKARRGRPFAREGVGWGYRNHRWVVETWDGESRKFNRKGEAEAWLNSRDQVAA